MSTITITEENRAQVLFDTFQEKARKHDLRTKRGQHYKELANEYDVTVGVSNLVVTKYNHETDQPEVVLQTVDALLVKVRDIAEAISVAGDYLRLLKPTRSVSDENYRTTEVPNVVRFASHFVHVEETNFYRYKDTTLAYEVVTVSLDDEGNTLAVSEVVNANHVWPVEGARYGDTVSDLRNIWRLGTEVATKRASDEAVKNRRARIDDAKKSFVASDTHKYVVSNARHFLASKTEPRSATDGAIIAEVRDLCEKFLKVVEKTTLEVSVPRLFSDDYYVFGQERGAVVIDYAQAINIVTHGYLRDNVRTSDTTSFLVAPVLQRFYQVLEN